MKRYFILILIALCFSQAIIARNIDSLKCSLLESFLNNREISKIISAGNPNNYHPIILYDSSCYFNNCFVVISGNPVIIEYTVPKFDLNRSWLNDSLDWRGKIIIHKVVRRKRLFEIFFYHRITNATGSLIFKLKRQKFIQVKSSIGII